MPSLVLRLLLMVSLFFNGIGNAVAAVAMPAMMDGGSHALMALHDPEPPVASACEPAEGDIAAIALSHPAAPSETHPADCEQDCCDQGDCRCPCMQLAQATLLDVPVVSTQLGHSRLAVFFPAGHATPALLHPIRPPIG